MHKYKHYQTIDFLCDDDFIEWVRTPRQETDLYWQEVFTRFPTVKGPAEEARQLLGQLHIKNLKGRTEALQAAVLMEAFNPGAARNGWSPKVLAKGVFYKWMVAALIILLAGVVVFMQQSKVNPKLEIVDINHLDRQVKNVDKKALLVLLPDQSTVILQPKAYIRYAANSFAFRREVYLVGEAFFDVSKDKRIPFVVQTDQLLTTVLGTSFFVKADPNIGHHEVQVATGAVRVQGKRRANQVASNVAEGLVIHAGEEILVGTDVPLRAAISAAIPMRRVEERKAAFDFQNVPMREVAKTLEVQYGLTVDIQHEVLAERTITAFLANVSLQEKLSLIAKAVEAQYTLKDGIVVFSLNTNQK